jgi:hypothetical protein
MEWGILAIVIVLTLVAYVIVQETRAQLHWRGLVEKGDVDAVRTLLQNEIDRWRSERVPKGMPALLWHGVQSAELVDVGPRAARINCSAEGEYTLRDGVRVETSTPLAEGMELTMKLADLVLYEVPNVKLEEVQIDVYAAYRDEAGRAETRCILSSRVRRDAVEELDWEATPAAEFIEVVGGRFRAGGAGGVLPVEPLPWRNGTAPEPEGGERR